MIALGALGARGGVVVRKSRQEGTDKARDRRTRSVVSGTSDQLC